MADKRTAAEEADRRWSNAVLRLIQRRFPHIPMSEYGDESRAVLLLFARDVTALAQAEQDVDLPALCSAIAKRLGESWLVVGPDGSRFVAQTPFRAASAANKHFGRLHYDPKQAAEFVEMIDKIRRDSERDNDRLITMYGSLNCPTCGGSGHIGDAEAGAYGYASRLAVAIWEKHYKDAAPEWKPLNDLMGVLTQIDNMTSDLTRRQAEAGQEQDAELSAALGWPGGISNPVLDRKVLLQKVAALAQQAEPVHPSGFAYRYPDGVRFNDGREVNGCLPSEVIPYYLGRTPPKAEPVRPVQLVAWQGGLSNNELLREWKLHLPGVEPTDRELSAFALGLESGHKLAQQSEPVQEMPSNTRYTVAVEGQALTYWDNIHDAIINAQRAVYADVDATTRAIDDLRAGRLAEWRYGFSAVRIYPPQQQAEPVLDLIPPESLFVCDQMWAHVTRVRLEQQAEPVQPVQHSADDGEWMTLDQAFKKEEL